MEKPPFNGKAIEGLLELVQNHDHPRERPPQPDTVKAPVKKRNTSEQEI